MAFGKKDNPGKKRFQTVSSNGLAPIYSVLVDTETGVNYLVCSVGLKSVDVTVMVDTQGKPIVTPV